MNGNGSKAYVLKHGGKLGAIGLALGAAGELGLVFGFLSQKLEHLAHGLTSAGGALAFISVAWHGKRTTDMIATVEAEKRIANPMMENRSSDPAIQREIEKQQAKSGS